MNGDLWLMLLAPLVGICAAGQAVVEQVVLGGALIMQADLAAEQDNWTTALLRFWSLRDPAVRTALGGLLILGLGTGALGPFLVLRRLSLLGDSLGHAVLPGVCLGFLVTATKDPKWIFSGALLSAALASGAMSGITRQTRLKPDVAMGLVLSGFFALGTVFLTRLQSLPYGSQSGLHQYLFGQASALLEEELLWLGGLTCIVVAGILLAYKELLLTSFDEGFAQSLGYPVRRLHFLLMTLVGLAIVISLQAVGVVLLSALLITPAVTARLWANRLPPLICLSAALSMFSAVIGLSLSYLGSSQPTGPYVVLVMSLLFVLSVLFAPRDGWIPRALRRRRQSIRTGQENLLRSILELLLKHLREPEAEWMTPPSETGLSPSQQAQRSDWVTMDELTTLTGQSRGQIERDVRALTQNGWLQGQGSLICLTNEGKTRAAELIRNYRLWEQFLIRRINLPSDHVQNSAEDLEHILGPDLVEQLQEDLARDAQSVSHPLPDGDAGASA